jgi:ABC-type uncharacterized transport system permease subunit
MRARLHTVGRAAAFVLLALILCGAIFETAGFSAPDMFSAILDGAFLSDNALAHDLRWACPLFVSATGVVIAFRCGYFNVGTQGQFYLGGIGAAIGVAILPGLPDGVVMVAALIFGIALGALWAFWPGWLRIRSGTDEVITTLMGNFIAGLLLVWVTSGPLKDPSGSGQVTSSRSVPLGIRISTDTGVSPIILGITIAVGVMVWVLVNRTAFGVLGGLAGRNPVMVTWQGARLSRLGPRRLPAEQRHGGARRRDGGARTGWPVGQRLFPSAWFHRRADCPRRQSLGQRQRDRGAVLRRPRLCKPLSAGDRWAALRRH